MERFTRALGSLIKVLSAIIAGLIVVGLALISVMEWSQSSTERASNECVVRRMDHHIEEESTGAYHDTCMAALGYRRVNRCYSGSLIAAPPFCFAPSWPFWKS
ncbi:hypothetical protein [Rhizobium sp. BK418]|uniref:hypothetical protein n=1 Tax=Rhizobium sp. BK418 TaxID=2512120 RepID=UPI00104C2164|nr:hypothetical protein [Rhizobium sp. BK418]TCR98615.1 hypothetical protein EV281_1085 [Rhizobium sp. BK418]